MIIHKFFPSNEIEDAEIAIVDITNVDNATTNSGILDTIVWTKELLLLNVINLDDKNCSPIIINIIERIIKITPPNIVFNTYTLEFKYLPISCSNNVLVIEVFLNDIFLFLLFVTPIYQFSSGVA